MLRRVGLALALGTLVLASCRTLPGAQPLAPGDPRPAAYLETLTRLADARHALRCRARVTVEGRAGARFARQLLLAERPARLRVEVLGLVGQRVAVLATDGARYELYRAEVPGVEAGPVYDGVLLEALGFALEPAEAVQLALGAPLARGEVPRPARSSSLGTGEAIRVELANPPRTLEFDEAGSLSRYALRDERGRPVLEARFGDYRDVEGSPFAHAIEIELPGSGTHAEITFSQVELNPELPDEVFRLRPGRAS